MSETVNYETQLHSIPIRNEKLSISHSKRTTNGIVIEVELKYKGLLRPVASWLRARNRKKYELAGLSLEMFEMIDGKHSVEDLVEWLCEQDKLTFLEGRALVTHYLRDLMQRGLVVLVAKNDDE